MKLEEAKTMQYVFQSNLNERSRGRTKSEEQKMALQNIKLFYEWQETVSKIALTKVKANNTSGNLLNEMRQITYSLYWSKEINKKVYKSPNTPKLYTILLLYLGYFSGSRAWSPIQGSKSKFDILNCILAIPRQLNAKKSWFQPFPVLI